MALGRLFRRETVLLLFAMALLAAGAALYFLSATTLTIAVAPKDGTEPELIQAYADVLAGRRENVRLKIVPFDDVRESGEALVQGRAQLAVVRPDVFMPGNGLTLAILRDQAMLIVAPETSGITSFPKLARKKLGIVAHRDADLWLLKTLLGYYGLSLATTPAEASIGATGVTLVTLTDSELSEAVRSRRVDAVVSIIAPNAPKALALVAAVRSVSPNGKISFVSVEDEDAIIERFPRLQAVTIPSGLFSGNPKIPADDIKTVGASYRLMASASLGRAAAADVTQHLFELRTAFRERTEAADYVKAPSYETTVEATSAQLPNHPGAIDYYEREQRGFIDRYGDLIYLGALLGGGAGSAAAWLKQRLARRRRERTDVVVDRLTELIAEVREARDIQTLSGLAMAIDDFAAEIVDDARSREVEQRTLSIVSLAIDAARSAVAERRLEIGPGAPARDGPRVVASIA